MRAVVLVLCCMLLIASVSVSAAAQAVPEDAPPSFVGETPSSVDETPSVAGETPSSVDETPSVAGETSSVVDETAPSADQSSTADEAVAPPAAEEPLVLDQSVVSRADAVQPNVETAPHVSDEPPPASDASPAADEPPSSPTSDASQLGSDAPQPASDAPPAEPAANAPPAEPASDVPPSPSDAAGRVSQPGPNGARPGFPYGVLVADIANAPRAREVGFRVMATTVSWKRTEPSRGQYPFEHTDQWGQTAPNDVTNVINAARSNGMQFGFRLIDPPDWAGGVPARVEPADLEDYVFHVVRYAHDSLAYFELFNEQNLPSEWGASPDPAGYARLMAAAYRGAKRADPNLTVISAGPSQRTAGRGGSLEDVDWLDRFLTAGGGASVDALGVHAYMGNFDASADPSCTPLCFGQVQEFRAVMERHADSGPMYVTEFGALEDTPTDLGQYNWMKLPSDTRAEYLVNAFRGANATYPWIAGATMFNLDYAAAAWIPSTSEQSWFSLLNPDKSPRPVFNRIRLARQSGDLP